MEEEKEYLLHRIKELQKEADAVILAHNYQVDEVQEAADFVGDSFDLSRTAARTQAPVIVFCGVHFMAESAAVLAPDKTILLPEITAGCPMADMVTVEKLRQKKKQYPRAAVVAYVNSSAAVKAESDICVTSSNAVQVVNSLKADEVIFVPDQNLGSYVAERTDKKIILWDGYCLTHHRIVYEDVLKAREAKPGALVVVHPECRPEVVKAADYTFSTSGILRFARETEAKSLIVGTEMGILYRLRRDNPDKEFFLLHPGLICPNMKYTHLAHVARALETLSPRITVSESIRVPASRALERMLAVA